MSKIVTGFPERLRKLRHDMGMTQSEFATRVDVSRGAISMYETGDRVPDIQFLYTVVQRMGCGYEYLMGECPKDSELIKRLNRSADAIKMITARTFIEQALSVLRELEAGE